MSADAALLLRSLHAPGELLVLPNVWDALSASVVERAGARALATSSAALAWSAGYADGEHLPFDELVRVVRAIARVTTVPLSVDFERGYADEPGAVADHVARLVEAGASGVNLEDGAEPADLLTSKLAAVRARLGQAVFLNARTCIVLRGAIQGDDAVPALLARARVYGEAGADGFFVPRLSSERDIEAVARGTPLALNVMIVPGLPPAAALRTLGVRRLSAGPGLGFAAMASTRAAAAALLERGDYQALLGHGLAHAEINRGFARAE